MGRLRQLRGGRSATAAPSRTDQPRHASCANTAGVARLRHLPYSMILHSSVRKNPTNTQLDAFGLTPLLRPSETLAGPGAANWIRVVLLVNSRRGGARDRRCARAASYRPRCGP